MICPDRFSEDKLTIEVSGVVGLTSVTVGLDFPLDQVFGVRSFYDPVDFLVTRSISCIQFNEELVIVS